MPVTDEQMEWLRAYLAGEFETAQEIHGHLARAGATAGLGALTHMAFVLAARQKFSPTWTRGDVVRFVGQVRAQLSERADVLPPVAAERELRSALGEKVTDLPRPEARGRAQIILLDALIQSQDLDGAAVAELLGRARELADQMLAGTS